MFYFAFEESGQIFLLIDKARNVAGPGVQLLYSCGSLGDHVIHSSTLKSLKAFDPKKRFAVLANQKFISLYRSFSTDGVSVIPLDQGTDNFLYRYFSMTKEWLSGNFPIIPLLPVFYPLIGYAVHKNKCITHLEALKLILDTESPLKLSDPNNLLELRLSASQKLQTLFGRKDCLVLIAPESQSNSPLPESMWTELIELLLRETGFGVLINSTRGFESFQSSPRVVRYFMTPEEIIPMLWNFEVVIGALSGLTNVAKIWTETHVILLRDAHPNRWDTLSGSEFTISQYSEVARTTPHCFFLESNDVHEIAHDLLSLLRSSTTNSVANPGK